MIKLPDSLHAAVRTKVNDELAAIIDKRLESSAALSSNYYTLWQEIKRTALAGGKRIRPYLVVLGYTLYSDDSSYDDILPAAVAYELLHIAMLVHDDIIDRDTVRHNEKTINGAYEEKYQTSSLQPSMVNHAANTAALLAGDALLTEAFMHLYSVKGVEASLIKKAHEELFSATYTVIGGELLDTEASYISIESAESVDPKTVALQKTASYSFESPLVTGAILAGASLEQQQIVRTCAGHIGIGFQYRDDMLGIFGEEAVTGKSSIGDVVEGKNTLLVQDFLQHASVQQRKAFTAVYGVPNLQEAEYRTVQGLMREAGTPERIEQAIKDEIAAAHNSIAQLTIDQQHQQLLRDLAVAVCNRER